MCIGWDGPVVCFTTPDLNVFGRGLDGFGALCLVKDGGMDVFDGFWSFEDMVNPLGVMNLSLARCFILPLFWSPQWIRVGKVIVLEDEIKRVKEFELILGRKLGDSDKREFANDGEGRFKVH
ncbi:Sua5/YciO/YrdC/YwlC family protein [Sesbania bispinosa]|nr:Sua5/YciO/YrdC/YwlC family protein [Sesbania bispinosa]